MGKSDKMTPEMLDQLGSELLYYAAAAGYYDTRLENLKYLKISCSRFSDVPKGATHCFIFQIEGTGYMVTRYKKNTVVEAYDSGPQERERILREGALDMAVCHFTKSRYHVGDGDEARMNSIKTLLSKETANETISVALSVHHPVVKDELPDCNMRRWSVSIGSHRCLVGLAKDSEIPEFRILP